MKSEELQCAVGLQRLPALTAPVANFAPPPGSRPHYATRISGAEVAMIWAYDSPLRHDCVQAGARPQCSHENPDIVAMPGTHQARTQTPERKPKKVMPLRERAHAYGGVPLLRVEAERGSGVSVLEGRFAEDPRGGRPAPGSRRRPGGNQSANQQRLERCRCAKNVSLLHVYCCAKN